MKKSAFRVSDRHFLPKFSADTSGRSFYQTLYADAMDVVSITSFIGLKFVLQRNGNL
jgi:hypothetical protein